MEFRALLFLAHLTLNPYARHYSRECRKKYEYTTHRQQTLLRLRPYFLSGDGTLSTHLLDQLPMLADLYRAVEEVGLMQCPVEAESVRSGVMVEAVADVYERVVKSVENTGGSSDAWKVLAERQWRKVFEGTDRREFMMSLSDLYHMDTLEQLLPDDPKCCRWDVCVMLVWCGAVRFTACDSITIMLHTRSNPSISAHCGLTAVQRCSRCKNEWYCGRACQVAGWKVHRPICDLLSTVANGRPEDGGADDAIAKEKCSAAVKSSSVGAGTKILGTSGPVTPGIVEL